MSETDPGYSKDHAGDVGAHRATVGTPTERESINVPPTRPGAAENAERAAAAREEHETFIPESPIPDERTEAQESLAVEEESMTRQPETSRDRRTARRRGTDGEEEDDVRKNIEETRRELGETVSALAGKADVKGRAAEAADTAKGKVAQATGTAKGKVAEATGAAKGKVAEATGTAKGKASEVAGKVREATPDQVKDAATEAKKRPVLLFAAAGTVFALVVRRIVRRRKAK
jgi:vacuolar-type H+-ATPase subunit H